MTQEQLKEEIELAEELKIEFFTAALQGSASSDTIKYNAKMIVERADEISDEAIKLFFKEETE